MNKYSASSLWCEKEDSEEGKIPMDRASHERHGREERGIGPCSGQADNHLVREDTPEK